MNRKSMFAICGCAALAGVIAFSSALDARPIPMYRPQQQSMADLSNMLGGVYAASGPVCETTGFEASEPPCAWELGFFCGSTFTPFCTTPGGGNPGGANPCTGDPSTDLNCCAGNTNPLNGWYMSISSVWCTEPHIDTVNPSSGEQHVRFTSDAAVGVGFGGSTRQTWFSPAITGLAVRPVSASFDLAMGDEDPANPPNGSNFITWFLGESVNVHVYIYWDYNGIGFLLNYDAGAFQPLAFLPGNGQYITVEIDTNPCGEPQIGLPAQSQQIRALDAGGGLINQIDINLANTGGAVSNDIARSIFMSDNGGFYWDADNYSVTRSVDGCPFDCGNGVFEPWGEECDDSAGEDSACPGRCGAPDGDTPCACAYSCPFCSNNDCEVTNGTNGPFITHGGWFSYTADTPFTGIDTCGSSYDTTLWWGIDPATCLLDETVIVNDECFDYGGDCTDGNHGPENCHPLASCYNDNIGSWESCLCAATTPGSTYYGWAAAFPTATPPVGSNLIVTVTKMLSCGAQGEAVGGACCDGTTGICTDDVEAVDCDGPSLHYTANKTCDLAGCGRDTGACCDAAPGLGGACTDGVLPEDCVGQYQTYSKLTACAEITCEEITGACCNRLTGNCFDSIQAACPVDDTTSWNEGLACGVDFTCNIALGACCDTGSVDPTVASCTETTFGECVCAKCTWTIDTSCSAVECNPNFQPIPTVSEWGLAVLALLLLVGGKIYFGRREAAIA